MINLINHNCKYLLMIKIQMNNYHNVLLKLIIIKNFNLKLQITFINNNKKIIILKAIKIIYQIFLKFNQIIRIYNAQKNSNKLIGLIIILRVNNLLNKMIIFNHPNFNKLAIII